MVMEIVEHSIYFERINFSFIPRVLNELTHKITKSDFAIEANFLVVW